MGNYKDSLNLPKTDFPIKSRGNEEEVFLPLGRPSCVPEYDVVIEGIVPNFVLHDGPPFANGDIHLGHVVNKVLKDIHCRYERLKGSEVQFIPGWDCHGLHIENKVRAQFGNDGPIRSESEIYAAHWVHQQSEQFQRLGIWADWERPYVTMGPAYEEFVLKQYTKLVQLGLVYRESRPVPWSLENRTALAMADIEYRDDFTSNSAYVAFECDRGKLVAWTTTPWSLASHQALAVHPVHMYALVEDNGQNYILAESAVKKVFPNGFVRATFSGSLLKNKEYVNPLTGETCKVLLWDTIEEGLGTGVVHIAPSHGEEDYELCRQYNIKPVCRIGIDGRYLYSNELKDLHVFKDEEALFSILEAKGMLVKREPFLHQYPFDARSGKPTITLLSDQVFISMDAPVFNGKSLRQKAIAACENVKFDPIEGKNRLIANLESRPDWCISRQREWGIKIPDTNYIFDVWFESGCSWFVTGADKANLYFEGTDQFRGWFLHSLLLSVALRGHAPYSKVASHGFVVKPDGKKVSKSDKEYVKAMDVIKEMGADPIRLWVSSIDWRDDMRVSPATLKDFMPKYNKIRNTLRFLVSNLYDYDGEYVSAEPMSLDGWARNELLKLSNVVYPAYYSMKYHVAYQALSYFCTETISAVYGNAMKDRLYCDEPNSVDRRRAQCTMAGMLLELCRLLEPIMPFLVLEIAQHCDLSKFENASSMNFSSEHSEAWDLLFKLRADALKQLEGCKSQYDKFKPVDAFAMVIVPSLSVLYRQIDFRDLEDLFGIGSVALAYSDKPEILVCDWRAILGIIEFIGNGRQVRRNKDVKGI